MPIEPPADAVIEWATDGGADKAKPSQIEYARGFQTADTTDFNSDLNWALNTISRGAKFVTRLSAPEVALYNMQKVATSPFGASLEAWHIRYDELADRWYATTAALATASDILCWDSADGITWSASKTTSTNANDQSCTSMWTNGSVCAVAATNHTGPTAEFWVSSDLTVANLAVAAGSFNNIAFVRDMLYDQDSSRWFVLGVNTAVTTGYIESSGDAGANWTLEHTSTDNLSCFATDQLGGAIALADDANSKAFVTGGMTGVWAAGTAGPNTSRECHYLPFADMYISVGLPGSMMTHPGIFEGVSGGGIDTDYDFDLCIYGNDFTLLEGDAGTRSADLDFYSMSSSAGKGHEDFVIEQFGAPAFSTSNDWDQDTTCSHGQGKIVFLGGTTDDLIVGYYGPPNTFD